MLNAMNSNSDYNLLLSNATSNLVILPSINSAALVY